jgi:MFS family permease
MARRRNLILLAICQALTLCATSTAFVVGGLAGLALAADRSLATLPVTAMIVGSAVSTLPVSLYMRRVGRRAGFALGASAGLAGVAVALAALHLGSFALLCLGALLFGVQMASAQYYRFAAADAAPAAERGSAISLVLGGGVLGALVGPEVLKRTVGMLPVPYAGAYASVAGYLALIALLVAKLRLPSPPEDERTGPRRPVVALFAQPPFIVAVLGAVLGYGVMNLLMVATPIAMSACGHGLGDAAFVIQWHMVAMFAPSFVTGGFIQRTGAPGVMLAGTALQAACVAIALAGVDRAHFWAALFLLGLGWNFLYVGASTLLTETCTPPERAKGQGVNELLVSAAMVLTSASSGWLVARSGWAGPNYLAAPLVAITGAAILWLMARRRPVQDVAAT